MSEKLTKDERFFEGMVLPAMAAVAQAYVAMKEMDRLYEEKQRIMPQTQIVGDHER